LLEDFSKELNIVKKIPCYKELKDEGKTKKEQMIEYNEYFLSRENSIIIKIFYPLIINVFICECGFETYSFERILDIPLLLPKNNNNLSVDLMSLIRNYFEGDEFKWETKCKKCKIKNKMHKKKIFLTILPKILILSIQRFNIINKSKSNKSIKLYEKINLKNFVDEELIENYSNFDYKLFGISNHSGSLNFGHYYAYVNIQGKWKEFNDSFVTNVNFSSVSTTAYALFYEKC
jgi:ubiquitin carboxyl-terminal hydrolase 2/21